MPPVAKPILTLLCLPLCAVAVAACGSTASTSSFKGEQHEVAQTIANLQSDATAAEQKKICAKDVAASVVSRLGGTKGCETAFKNQIPEVDTLEVTVESVQLGTGGTTATARVQSTYGGKKKITTVSLLKEGNAWKLTSLG